MGQQRPVTVKRLYVPGSVEERIMELTRLRMLGGGAAAMNAGSLKDDKREMRTDELDLLFREPQL